ANSGGHVQWLGRPNKNAVHLRTPDYVLYSPSPSSKETTSEFTIRRDMSDYTLDIADDRLRERETYVLKEVMNHIADWDAANEKKHPVIGVQINNEFIGMRT
ncbi:glycoside hydrolase, partial [Bacteroides ovatus]